MIWSMLWYLTGFSPPLTQKAHVLKQPLVVSNWTNGLSQLKNRLSSGYFNEEKSDTLAVPLSWYEPSSLEIQHKPSISFHDVGSSMDESHSGRAFSPSPLMMASIYGFDLKKPSLSPRNSGPPHTICTLSSSCTILERTSSCIRWVNSQNVAAITSGFCSATVAAMFPGLSLIVPRTTDHSQSALSLT